MNEVKLKPCPFCGSEAYPHEQNYADRYVIECEECGVRRTSEILELAVKKWNERQLETELIDARAEIERLKDAIKTVQSAFKNYKNADAEAAKIEMREAKILAASCNSDSVDSERAANAMLTDEIERKNALIEQMREALREISEECGAVNFSSFNQVKRAVEISAELSEAALSAAERLTK